MKRKIFSFLLAVLVLSIVFGGIAMATNYSTTWRGFTVNYSILGQPLGDSIATTQWYGAGGSVTAEIRVYYYDEDGEMRYLSDVDTTPSGSGYVAYAYRNFINMDYLRSYYSIEYQNDVWSAVKYFYPWWK